MKFKSLTKGLLATAALALAIVAAPASLVRAEGDQGTYTVEKNDNLSKIAKKIYGNEKMWRVIYDANSGVVKNDYIIYTGQLLTIPAANDNSAATPAPAAPATTPAPTPAAPEATPAPTTPEATPAPTTPAPTPATPEATPAPAPTTPAPSQEEGYVLDYNQIASWVTGGFVGVNEAGEAVIFGIDSNADNGIIIFANDSTMEAASFVGPITENGNYMTITDETNGLALTFGVTEVGDSALALDLGEVGGTATVAAQERDAVLNFIQMAIAGYKFVS